MIELAAGLQLLIGTYTSLAIIFHVQSQIRRWQDQTNLFKKSLTWLETYMILFILIVSLLVAWVAYFKLGPGVVASAQP